MLAWSGETQALPVACLFPTLWAFAPNRFVATLVALAYFLAASRGLPAGVSIFYATDMGVALGLWFAASLLFVLVHGLLWPSKPGWQRSLRYAIALFLMAFPPFGITGWASPITVAGVLFPGWGWISLLAMAFGLLAMTTRVWPIAGLGLCLAWAASAVSWIAPQPPAGWAGIDTQFNQDGTKSRSAYGQQQATAALVRKAAKKGVTRIVLPEGAFGTWTPTTEHFWRNALSGLDVTVAGGAIVVDETGYDNVMIEVSGHGARILYRERMPVPISMWQPWTTGGVRAQFFDNPRARFAGTPIAPLICYEQLLIWPVLQSMIPKPEVIVAIGNGWWTGETNIIAVQRASAEAWASLFHLPLVTAFNK
nr:conjugal transfer protein TraB [Hartmannibacter diazotrophicus]